MRTGTLRLGNVPRSTTSTVRTRTCSSRIASTGQIDTNTYNIQIFHDV